MKTRTVQLGEVCEINPPTDFGFGPDEACTFVPMETVDDVSAQITKLVQKPFREVAKGYTPFAERDVIVAKITPCMENGKCAIAFNLRNKVAFGSTEFHVLRASKHVIPEWLFYFWRFPPTRKLAEKHMTGSAGQKRVPVGFMEKVEIPLPDMSEQQRIAGQLEQADRLCRTRRYALELSDTFLPATFIELFGSPFSAAKRFPVCELGEATTFIDYRGIAPNKVECGVRLVTARNVKRGFFELDPQEFIPFEEYNSWMRRGMPRPGDVLFTTEGHTLGSAAKLPRFDKVALAQRLIALQPGNQLGSDFLLYLILSRWFQEEVVKRSTGSAARGISSKQLAEIPVPVPPFPMQQQFASLVERHERLRAGQRETLRQAEHLFQSLLHQAFTERIM